jgi:hypothetical protein
MNCPKKFDTYYNLVIESLTMNELLHTTDFESIKKLDTIKVYRSSARPSKTSYESGVHAGSKKQALIRADYMVNDEGKYMRYYLYELEVKLGKVWPMLEGDNGTDHGNDFYKDIMGEYDTVIYKNTGEGNIKDNNLSIVCLNPHNIISSRMVKTLTGTYLDSIQNELYH